jgi:hypothetical protein
LQSHSEKNNIAKYNFVKRMSQYTNTNTKIRSHTAKETLKYAVKSGTREDWKEHKLDSSVFY